MYPWNNNQRDAVMLARKMRTGNNDPGNVGTLKRELGTILNQVSSTIQERNKVLLTP